jgi:formylglycine-generating enzyme required for sulfatase activity/cellulose biosynthesis protein BcsQ
MTHQRGRIITFYSYKGGTGRTMALANVAWLLASRGYKVLAIDWDLEAPGLHRYFEPFIADKALEKSTGIIDFAIDFASAAVVQTKEEAAPDWYVDYANIRAHAIPVDWEFPGGGLLHLVPAGRQDSGYPIRVNAFDWRQFYERLGGGVWLEAVKRQMRDNYDCILVDSRTGVSDTSGICTVQMPDDLVVCFTLNNQSMRGASAIAHSALEQRRAPDGSATLKVWPLPMRVESAEQERLQVARALARTRFSRLMEHMPLADEDAYWGEMEIAYYPIYAYEEILATFGDRPRHARSLLAGMEKLVSFLVPNAMPGTPMPEDVRLAGWQKFTSRPAAAAIEDLKLLCEEYVRIRTGMSSGGERTYKMSALLERASAITGQEGVAQVAEALFAMGTDGGRVIGLALARRDPRRTHIDMVIEGIARRRSPFEQYHALVIASLLLRVMDPTAREKLREAIQNQIGTGSIAPSDADRWNQADRLLQALEKDSPRSSWAKPVETLDLPIAAGGTGRISCVEIQPPSDFLHYDDLEEQHGPWIGTRQSHSISLPRAYRLGRNLVTNAEFQEFVMDGGYRREEFWPARLMKRARFLFSPERKARGPMAWVDGRPPTGKEMHPVTGICFYEALAFTAWLQREAPVAGWIWTLPREDEWEFAARTEAGLVYPWGDSFDASKCNSAESEIGGTTEVEQFASGASRHGCRDMAGNVWEFLRAEDRAREDWCVMRGGSFKNDRALLRSYLRLFGVPREHRPADFGFRVAQELASL